MDGFRHQPWMESNDGIEILMDQVLDRENEPKLLSALIDCLIEVLWFEQTTCSG